MPLNETESGVLRAPFEIGVSSGELSPEAQARVKTLLDAKSTLDTSDTSNNSDFGFEIKISTPEMFQPTYDADIQPGVTTNSNNDPVLTDVKVQSTPSEDAFNSAPSAADLFRELQQAMGEAA